MHMCMSRYGVTYNLAKYCSDNEPAKICTSHLEAMSKDKLVVSG